MATNIKPSYNVLTLEHPNMIIQMTAGDLRAFAEELISNAQAVAKQIEERRNKSDQLLTIDEASALLGVSKMTLNRWHHLGVLKKVEIGGKRRYRKSDIERMSDTKL